VPTDKKYVTAEDAAKLLSCTSSNIRKKQSRGELKVVGRLKKIVSWSNMPRKIFVNLYDRDEVLKLCKR